MDDKLKNLREKIDVLDQQIMKLLNERFSLSVAVGEVKKTNNGEILDKNREQIIFDKTSNFSHSPQIINTYKTIMNESKALQRK